MERLDVRFHSSIARVERKEAGVVLWLEEADSTARAEACDFLVWAAPAQQLLQVVDGQVEERQVVAGQRTLSVFASLVRTRGVRRLSPISVFLPTLRERREGGVLAMGDLAAARREGMATNGRVMEAWREEGGTDTVLDRAGQNTYFF